MAALPSSAPLTRVNVDLFMREAVTPFLKLSELGGICDKVGEWMVPSSTHLTLFLEHAPLLTQPRPRARIAAVSNRSAVRPMLALSGSKKEKSHTAALYTILPDEVTLLDILHTGGVRKDIGEHSRDSAMTLACTASTFANLLYRYINNKGVVLSLGDIVAVEHPAMRPLVYVYTGTTLQICIRGNTRVPILPSEFSCPAPFPVAYWANIHVYGMPLGIRPNFDQFAGVMEFDRNPPKLAEPRADHEESPAFPTNAVALRFKHEEVMYYIYFFPQARNTALTYDEVMDILDRVDYVPHSETIMYAYATASLEVAPVARHRGHALAPPTILQTNILGQLVRPSVLPPRQVTTIPLPPRESRSFSLQDLLDEGHPTIIPPRRSQAPLVTLPLPVE